MTALMLGVGGLALICSTGMFRAGQEKGPDQCHWKAFGWVLVVLGIALLVLGFQALS
jgi:hypothetical protein